MKKCGTWTNREKMLGNNVVVNGMRGKYERGKGESRCLKILKCRNIF